MNAKPTALDACLARDLITKFQRPNHVEYYLTDAAYAAIGKKMDSMGKAGLQGFWPGRLTRNLRPETRMKSRGEPRPATD